MPLNTAPTPDAPAAAKPANAEETPGEPLSISEKYPNLEKLLNLELPLVVVLAEKTVKLEDALSFSEGAVIVFKKHSSEPLDILVNNRRIGAGKTIKVGERFGVHVRQIGTPLETLNQLK